MKILFISFAFPPYNTSGAVRVGKLVTHLSDCGHDVRVVTAKDLSFPADLNLPVRVAAVERTGFFNVTAPLDWSRARLAGRSSPANGDQLAGRSGLIHRVANLYRAVVAIPDAQIGWFPAALRAAHRLVANWTPDVIISSALPFTGHLVAARLARTTGRPWIAEFRDLFADNPYNDVPDWRRWFDRRIECATLANASACVTVSPSLAEALRSRHGKPTAVVLNGFDPEDVLDCEGPPTRPNRCLRIVYTGIIYPGRRDPSPLFEGIRRLGPRRQRVEVVFYGQDLRGVRGRAMDAGVADRVTTHAPVAYADSIRLQCEADVLLLLLWNDARERGVYTGKLFEYVGARRPILAVGCGDGIAAGLIRERGLGVTATDPDDIAAALDRWIGEIDASGTVVPPPSAASAGLSRQEQFAQYESFLQRVAAAGGSRVSTP